MRKELVRWLAAGVFPLSAIGCATPSDAPENLGASSQASQCGSTWDVQHVELYNGALGVTQDFVNKHQRPVGHLQVVGCSGTLVSRDLFLSAGHCGYTVGNVVRFNYQVDGNNSPNLRTDFQDFQVIEVLEQQNNTTLDYALVRLEGSPGDQFGWTPMLSRDQAANSTVALIQHPAMSPKKVHTGPVVDYNSGQGVNWFRHQADTTGGSSGSGVLSTDGFIIGVHTNAGCETDGTPEGNSAIRMTSLVASSERIRHLVNGDIPLVGDFDEDGKMDDIAVWRPSNGMWYAKRTDNTVLFSDIQWGQQGDIPLVGDFDGDGKMDDLAVWRPSTGMWNAKRKDNTIIFSNIQWGQQGDIPLVGDFDGDGQMDDLAVWRPSTGMWNAKRKDNTVIFSNVQWGQQGDIPLVGDFDGDGQMDDLAVWRPSTGMWNAKRKDNTTIFSNIQWGQMGDVPFVGDFDGDGKMDDLAVWRPSTGMWNAKRTNNTVIFSNIQWGALEDFPLVADFDGDGVVDDLGVWRPSTSLWHATRTNGSTIFSNIQWGQAR